MKKVLSFLLVFVLGLSLSLGALAAAGGNGKGGKKSDTQKEFRFEQNERKKEASAQKRELEQQREQLEAQIGEMLASGDEAGAQAAQEDLAALDGQIAGLRAEIKKIINERFMIAKTLYTEEELAQFENAAALIEQMYADASALEAGSVTVKNNIIKFEVPPYIKGGKTIVPVRAITEALGAEVSWDADTRTVTITKDDTVVVMTAGSTAVLVNGVEQDMGAAAGITCGRTFVPLRFLAETFGLEVTWDGENETVDIDEEADDGESSGEPEDSGEEGEDGTSGEAAAEE